MATIRQLLEVENDSVKILEEAGYIFYRGVFTGSKGSVFQFGDPQGNPIEFKTPELISKAAEIIKGGLK